MRSDSPLFDQGYMLILIEKSRLPILDIYGEQDFKRVIGEAPDRRLAAKKGGNKHYDQYEIEGADHYFNKMENVLVKRIRGWLDKAAPGVAIIVKDDIDSGSAEKNEQTESE